MEDDLELAEIENMQDIGKGDQDLGQNRLDIDGNRGQLAMDNPLYESTTTVAE